MLRKDACILMALQLGFPSSSSVRTNGSRYLSHMYPRSTACHGLLLSCQSLLSKGPDLVSLDDTIEDLRHDSHLLSKSLFVLRLAKKPHGAIWMPKPCLFEHLLPVESPRSVGEELPHSNLTAG